MINTIYNGCTVVRISYNNVVNQLTKTNLQSSGEFETTFLSNILKIFTSADYLKQFNVKSVKLFEIRRWCLWVSYKRILRRIIFKSKIKGGISMMKGKSMKKSKRMLKLVVIFVVGLFMVVSINSGFAKEITLTVRCWEYQQKSIDACLDKFY